MHPPRQSCADATEPALQPIQLSDEILDFKDNRSHDTQITRAMLADGRLVLDRFSAERTFHQTTRPNRGTLTVAVMILAAGILATILSQPPPVSDVFASRSRRQGSLASSRQVRLAIDRASAQDRHAPCAAREEFRYRDCTSDRPARLPPSLQNRTDSALGDVASYCSTFKMKLAWPYGRRSP